jgi:hypothetical protein
MAGERGRELGSAVAALAIHALLLGAVAARAPHVRAENAPPPPEPPADTFDIEPTPPAGRAEQPLPATPERHEEPQASAQGRTPVTVAPREQAPPGEPATQAPAAEPAAPADTAAPPAPAPASTPADEYGSPPPPSGGGGIAGLPPGMGGPLWALPGVLPEAAPPAPAPTTPDAPRPVDRDIATQVLAGTVHSKDKGLGVDVPGAGVVATTLGDAMRASSIRDARATIEVDLAANGTVQGIRVVKTTTGDAQTWAGIASAARSALAGRTLAMGADGKSVTVVVKLESKVQYPAGTKTKYDVQPLCANEVFLKIAGALQDIATSDGAMARGVRDDQGNFIPYSDMDEEQLRRFCIPIGIAVKGDLSNIGAHTTNVVRSSFEVKRAGEKALPAEATLPVDTRAPWLPAEAGKTRVPQPPKKKKNKKP